ncbi:hypothetical protein BH09MYX1_BH09MYX1_15260 [soil metagenome]
MQGRRRTLVIGGAALVAVAATGLATAFLVAKPPAHPLVAAAPILHLHKSVAADGDEEAALQFRPPASHPATLSCDDAKRIVKDFRDDQLAYVATSHSPKVFADALADWLDPLGVWSASADSPVAAELERDASALLDDLQGGAPCVAPARVGASLVRWIASLRKSYDAAKSSPGAGDLAALSAEPLAPQGTRVSLDFARSLGARHAALSAITTPDFGTFLVQAEDQLFPTWSEAEWGEVVLAAAVRAYVDVTDPHSQWAPYGEEASVYDVDLEAERPPRLWDRATRTIRGGRLEEGALPPLVVGDVLLEVNQTALAGLSVEQLDQASYGVEADSPANVTLLRDGKIIRLTVSARDPVATTVTNAPFDLSVDRVPFGVGDVAIIAIHDVYDDLGALVERAMVRERDRVGGPPLVGVVLDLRGNGGGSTEGAIDTLGLFLPGAKLFPMKRRDGTIETDRAPEPKVSERWSGPLATLVDAGTASAAEMIAGALAAYRRAPIVGTTTYGKGCAQEYMEDVVHSGVLRVTTLLYALPDGTSVQRVGLVPTYQFPFEPEEHIEREATQANAPPSWSGPDVREGATKFPAAPWPAHLGVVGPCRDPAACRAIDLLGDEKKRVANVRAK